MGTECSCSVIIGYELSSQNLQHLVEKREEISHTEDRYDPKTGVKLAPIKIVDKEANDVWCFNGQDYDELRELVEAIGEEIGCESGVFGYVHGPWTDQMVFFAIDVETARTEGADISNITYAGNIDLKFVVDQYDEVLTLGLKLRRAGIPVKNPAIIQTISVY